MPETPSATQIVKIRLVDNGNNPIMLPVGRIMASWCGHILEKDDGKYIDWVFAIKLELFMVQLWDYIFDPPSALHATYAPWAYYAWMSNKHQTCAFLKQAISMSERKLCADEEDLVTLWEYLKIWHGGAVPSRQVQLLQEAVTTKCSLAEPLTKMVDAIFEKIDHAFDAGKVTKELLKSIAVLSFLSDRSFAYIWLIISHNLRQGMETYGPTEIRHFLKEEQTLLEADKVGNAPDNTPSTALLAKGQKSSKITCSTCKAQKHPIYVYMGHTTPWCILEGGQWLGRP